MNRVSCNMHKSNTNTIAIICSKLIITYICTHNKYIRCSHVHYLVLHIHMHISSYVLVIITVARLSINGTTVDSVTDRDNEPQYHVKEDAGSIILCIRVESFPEDKDNLTIDYYTLEDSACK